MGKIPTAKLVKAALKKRPQAEPSGEQRPPAPKRPRARVPEPPVQPVPPTAPEIDLTADTPPEGVMIEEAATVEPAAAEEVAAVEELPIPGEPTPDEARRSWGEGPSGAASPPPGRLPSGSPLSIGSETAEAAEGNRATPGSSQGSASISKRQAERLISSILLPGVQEELTHTRTSTFYQEAYIDLVKLANSMAATRVAIEGGKALMREIQQEADEARARAEAAEEALESARTARADEIKVAKDRAEAALQQLTKADSAVAARDRHISELTAAIRAAENQANEAKERAKAAEDRAKAAEEKANKAEEEISRAREAEKIAVAALAAEKGIRAAEVEAAVGARTANIIEEYKASERYTDELAEASTEVFLQGFQYGKEKVARDLNFPQAREVGLEDLTDVVPPENRPGPTEP